MAGLERFIEAQQGIYEQALSELTDGAKSSHWMWFIFPQLVGLGHSETALYYAIANLDEARDYLAHPILGPRLAECTAAMLSWAGKRSAKSILGHIDTVKFASSMTLFEAAGGGPCCAKATDIFFAGKRDQRTLDLLAAE